MGQYRLIPAPVNPTYFLIARSTKRDISGGQLKRMGISADMPRVTCSIVGGAWNIPSVYLTPERLGEKIGPINGKHI